MEKTKKWYHSKTIWVGALQTLAGIMTAVAGELELGGTLTTFGVLQIILRVISTQKLS